MPAVLAMLGGVLLNLAASLAGRVLIALGFGAVTYAGVSVTLDWLKARALDAFVGLSAQILGILSMLKIGEAISILFSALLVRLLLNGLSAGGSISRLVKGS
jgi:hypothetical protein